MKVTLSLTSKPARLVIEGISHDEALDIIDNKIAKSNMQMADSSNKVLYQYIPGPLNIIGHERWLRNFCEINNMKMEVVYPFPPMPAN